MNQEILVLVRENDSPQEILEILEKIQEPKIIFLVETRSHFFADLAQLKKLKNNALEIGKIIQIYGKTEIQKRCAQTVGLDFCFLKEGNDLEMKKKYDIQDFYKRITAKKNTPPKEKKNIVSTVIGGKGKKTARASFFSHHIKKTSSQKTNRSAYFFVFLFLLILTGFVFFWLTPKATLFIKPKISSHPIIQNIMVALPNVYIPFEERLLPKIEATPIETNMASIDTFPSTHREYDLNHASGRVTIYNATDESVDFLPSRLTTGNGLIFRFRKNIKIPRKNLEGPGSVVVEVFADPTDIRKNPIGHRGNILAGTDLYFLGLPTEARKNFYAKANHGSFTGGKTMIDYFVAPDDCQKAQEIITENFKIRSIPKIKEWIEKISKRDKKTYVLLPDFNRFFLINLKQYECDETQIGKAQSTFSASGEAIISGVTFDQSEVIKVLEEMGTNNLDFRKKLITIDTKSLQYDVIESDDVLRWIKFSVSASGVESLDLDSESVAAIEWRNELKKSIQGKTYSDAISLLVNNPDIEEVSVRISPFWIKKIPTLLDRIDLRIGGG